MLSIGRLSADHDTYVDENEKEVSLIEIHIKLKGKDDDFPVWFLIKRAQSKINIDCGLVFRKFNRINKKVCYRYDSSHCFRADSHRCLWSM